MTDSKKKLIIKLNNIANKNITAFKKIIAKHIVQNKELCVKHNINFISDWTKEKWLNTSKKYIQLIASESEINTIIEELNY